MEDFGTDSAIENTFKQHTLRVKEKSYITSSSVYSEISRMIPRMILLIVFRNGTLSILNVE